jgi:hypothetical protein
MKVLIHIVCVVLTLLCIRTHIKVKSRIRTRIKMKSWIRIRIKEKKRELWRLIFYWSRGGPEWSSEGTF